MDGDVVGEQAAHDADLPEYSVHVLGGSRVLTSSRSTRGRVESPVGLEVGRRWKFLASLT